VCAVRVLSLGGADLGKEDAAAVARALESGRCGLTSLDLNREWGGAAGGPGRGGVCREGPWGAAVRGGLSGCVALYGGA
jgi:hypothetical protein